MYRNALHRISGRISGLFLISAIGVDTKFLLAGYKAGYKIAGYPVT
jgi:succinate dehydrogenase/fumarate reductase cytochrome b subunit